MTIEGLHNKYKIQRVDGEPLDPGAKYFVLRYDDNARDMGWVDACRDAMVTLALNLKHLPDLVRDIKELAKEEWGVVLDEDLNVLEEANKITHGARRRDYGSPLDDYQRVADMFNALFSHKLKENFSAEDMPMIVMLMKMSRQINRPKRDNMVDIAGYAWVVQECLEELERRQDDQEEG